MKNTRMIIALVLVLVGAVLFIDQLYLFGIPLGGFLGDLSYLDITGSDLIHHWMVGIVLVVLGIIVLYRK